MPYPSLAPFVAKRPWLRNMLKPVANWYGNAAGYRQLGLLFVATLPIIPPLPLPPRAANRACDPQLVAQARVSSKQLA
jgi:hypothetical protein